MPRPSPVTDVVRELFESRRRHSWSLQELHEEASEKLGAADYSSVFRAAQAMEREGVVSKIDVGDGKARFELRDDHHEHIRCENCGRVAEVPGCSLDDVEAAVRKTTGYEVLSHQLIFTGRCPDCTT